MALAIEEVTVRPVGEHATYGADDDTAWTRNTFHHLLDCHWVLFVIAVPEEYVVARRGGKANVAGRGGATVILTHQVAMGGVPFTPGGA